jgi:hypothetical protein
MTEAEAVRVQFDISKLKVKHLIELEKAQKSEEFSFERVAEILDLIAVNVDVYELSIDELREVFQAIDTAVEEATPVAPRRPRAHRASYLYAVLRSLPLHAVRADGRIIGRRVAAPDGQVGDRQVSRAGI